MKCWRQTSLLAGWLLLAAGAFPAGGASAETAEPAYTADDIREVHMSQADLVFMPYYHDRPEDRPALAKVADLLNQVTSRGKVDTTPAATDGETLFFRYDMTIRLQDDSSAVLYIAGENKLSYEKTGSPRLTLEDPDVFKEFLSLEAEPESAALDKSRVRIGENLRLKGSDAELAQGELLLFWDESGTYSSVHSEQDGLDYPSKTAVMIGRGTYKFGRYDLTFAVPAAGRTWDGRFARIHPGKGYLIAEFGFMSEQIALQLDPARSALLAVNGVPAADPAAAPIVTGGRTMVPLRAAAALIGRKVQWDPLGRNVLIRTDVSQASPAPAGSVGIWVGGKPADADARPFIRSGVTYVPIRLLADVFQVPIEWWPDSRVVNLTVENT